MTAVVQRHNTKIAAHALADIEKIVEGTAGTQVVGQ